MRSGVSKYLNLILLVLGLANAPIQANAVENEPLRVLASSGGTMIFDGLPNVAWVVGQIENGDYFHLRRMLRRHSVDVIVLDSPGGSVFEALQMAGIVHDQGLATYIPVNANCASACAYIYFGGRTRISDGNLGVHQFFGASDQAPTDQTQFTVSEIVGFLNEFETPPFVFEYMFEDRDMYYFTPEELRQIERNDTENTTLSNEAVASINAIFEQLLDELEPTESNPVAVKPSTTTEPTENAPHLTENQIKLAVQAELNRVGCTLGSVDGIIGRRSIAALDAFFDEVGITENPTSDVFTDFEFLQVIRTAEAPVCLTPPVVPTPDLDGLWTMSIVCPRLQLDAVANITGDSGRGYQVVYSNSQGDIASGSISQNAYRASGEIIFRNGVRTSFNGTIAQSGRSFSGSSSDGCQFRGNRR